MAAVSQLSNRYSSTERPLSKKQKINKYLYNKENKTCCKRNIGQWCRLLLYVTIFTLVILGAGFAITYITCIQFLHDEGPYFNKFSGNPVNPGLSFFPKINKGSSVIWYSTTTTGEGYMKIVDYTTVIEDKLKVYDTHLENMNNSSYTVDCETPGFKKGSDDVCRFKRESLGNCSSGSFGYDDMQPCFYLKINKIPTWKPVYFSKVLPKMPEDLQKIIKMNSREPRIWVHCKGKRAADVEHMGIIDYYPYQGFSGYYFPHFSIHSYFSPLVAIKFRNLTKGYLVSVRCSVWAENFLRNQLLIQVYVE